MASVEIASEVSACVAGQFGATADGTESKAKSLEAALSYHSANFMIAVRVRSLQGRHA